MDESSSHAMVQVPAPPLPVKPISPELPTTKNKNTQQPQQQQPNRLQNSVRLLLKQASDFQQQHQQKKNNAAALSTSSTRKSNSFDPVMTQNANTIVDASDTCGNLNLVISSNNTAVHTNTVQPLGASVVAVVDDAQNQPVLLKQAGAALQQQIRGLRRRVKSVRSLQQQSQTIANENVVEGSSSQNSESQQDYADVLMTSSRRQVAIVSPHLDDMNDALDVSKLTPKKMSPIPKNTFKIDLQEQHRSSSSSAIVSHPDSLYDAICIWYDALYGLLTGPEMVRLLYSTGHVYYYGLRFGIQTMALPITVPVQIGCTIGDIFVRTTLSILPAADTTTRQNVLSLSQHQSSGQVSEEEDVHSDQQHHDGGLFGGILSIPGTILHITGKVVVAIVAPVLGGGGANDDLQKQQSRQKQSTGASSSPEEKEKAVFYAKTPSRCPTSNNGQVDYLERLRLDFKVKDVDPMPRRKLFSSAKDGAIQNISSEYNNVAIATPVIEQSEFLLRVNDWGVSRPTDDGDLYYIDISPTAMNGNKDNHKELVAIALDRFVQGAISLLNSHPVCRIDVDGGGGSSIDSTMAQQEDLMAHLIQWHPEGSTKRLLRERSQAASPTAHDQSHPFRDDILIWSGRFQHEVQNGYGRKHGFFLARGCIPMSPDNFVKLLWDNSRTSEYNNFCLGRFTLHGLTCSSTSDDDQSFLDGTSKTASKIIQSEMRVPFAGITVKAVCLMHVRPLTTNDGYIICSRSLDIGPSGIQTATSIVQQLRCNNGSSTISPAKNEILWGVNIIRSIPNHPNGTELTSLSQVGSAVPSFLAQKIGLMGIGDFFKNVRQVAERNIST